MNRQRIRISSSILLVALTVWNPITLPLALLGIWRLHREWRRGPDRPAASGGGGQGR
jgi:hypothetical protein